MCSPGSTGWISEPETAPVWRSPRRLRQASAACRVPARVARAAMYASHSRRRVDRPRRCSDYTVNMSPQFAVHLCHRHAASCDQSRQRVDLARQEPDDVPCSWPVAGHMSVLESPRST